MSRRVHEYNNAGRKGSMSSALAGTEPCESPGSRLAPLRARAKTVTAADRSVSTPSLTLCVRPHTQIHRPPHRLLLRRVPRSYPGIAPNPIRRHPDSDFPESRPTQTRARRAHTPGNLAGSRTGPCDTPRWDMDRPTQLARQRPTAGPRHPSARRPDAPSTIPSLSMSVAPTGSADCGTIQAGFIFKKQTLAYSKHKRGPMSRGLGDSCSPNVVHAMP